VEAVQAPRGRSHRRPTVGPFWGPSDCLPERGRRALPLRPVFLAPRL